ncbi:hypothetical protein B0H67DRAFT_78893 [Lasiosphaeris hirsuta]|uniref:Uncharacterized protein n=1 Tax=Lasiosphaeris hirsuta TaxID=260670 RepID=A0AA40BC57_9PEZI|nr:hypothetical protein B0H67DRAFT_78893 [Lasiosphaeris hirsuta]
MTPALGTDILPKPMSGLSTLSQQGLPSRAHRTRRAGFCPERCPRICPGLEHPDPVAAGAGHNLSKHEETNRQERRRETEYMVHKYRAHRVWQRSPELESKCRRDPSVVFVSLAMLAWSSILQTFLPSPWLDGSFPAPCRLVIPIHLSNLTRSKRDRCKVPSHSRVRPSGRMPPSLHYEQRGCWYYWVGQTQRAYWVRVPYPVCSPRCSLSYSSCT